MHRLPANPLLPQAETATVVSPLATSGAPGSVVPFIIGILATPMLWSVWAIRLHALASDIRCVDSTHERPPLPAVNVWVVVCPLPVAAWATLHRLPSRIVLVTTDPATALIHARSLRQPCVVTTAATIARALDAVRLRVTGWEMLSAPDTTERRLRRGQQ